MILFLNVFIAGPQPADSPFGNYYDPGLLSRPDRLEVFEYALASLAPLPWSRVVVYCELDEPFAARRGAFEARLQSLFPEVESYPFRNDRQAQWQEAWRRLQAGRGIGDERIWFLCDDDHVFVAPDAAVLAPLEAELARLEREHPFVELNFSHWPTNAGYYRTQPVLEDAPTHFTIAARFGNSRLLVNQALMEHWFFARDHGDRQIRRIDEHPQIAVPETLSLIPKRELCRHFQGYSHVGLDIEACPPLAIPDGFWEGAIDVRVGGARRPARGLWVQPRARPRAVSPDGADWPGLADELPLCWQSRLGQVEVCDDPEPAGTVAARDRVLLRMLREGSGMGASEVARVFAPALRGPAPSGADRDADAAGARAWVRTQKRDCATASVTHSVLLLDADDSAQADLPELRAAFGPEDRVQILWLNVSRRPDARLRKPFEVRPVDGVLHVCFEGEAHVARALNEGLSRCRGRYLTALEIPRAPTLRASADLLAKIERRLEATDEPGVDLVWTPCWEVQAASARATARTALPDRVSACLSLRRADALRFGGWDEDASLRGPRGGVYELGRRMLRHGARAWTNDGIDLWYSALPQRPRAVSGCSDLMARAGPIAPGPRPRVERPGLRTEPEAGVAPLREPKPAC